MEDGAANVHGDARFAEYERDFREQEAKIKQQYGSKKDAVEKVIREKGYEPEELGWIVSTAGARGVPGTNGSPDQVAKQHHEVLQAVADELGVDFKGAK